MNDESDAPWWAGWPGRPLWWRFGRRTVLRLQGPDAVRYANGQVTRDLRQATCDRALAACVTTAKGQFQFLVSVSLAADGAVRVDGPADQAEALLARLDRYLIADDAELLADPEWRDWSLHHLVGWQPDGVDLPPGVVHLQSDRMGAAGWDLWCPPAAEQRLIEALRDVGPEGPMEVTDRSPASAAEFARILLGVPAHGSELDEKTLPPEAGLDRWTIDYRKGCYIGQEVLSRIYSVGRVNRKLVRLWGEAGGGVQPGDDLIDPGAGEGASPVGRITSVATHPQLDRLVALAYVRRQALESPRLLGSGSGGDHRAVLHRIPDSFIVS